MARLAFASIALLFGLLAPAALAAGQPCGMSPSDWCTSASDGPCGAHRTETACRADPQCIAQRYSGESVVACHWDERGFAKNCPSVGCLGR
jgi:hypothetical protein